MAPEDGEVGIQETRAPRPAAATAARVWRAAALVALLCAAAALGWCVVAASHSGAGASFWQESEVRASVSGDGRSATVRFLHDGQDHSYRLLAASVFTDDAEVFAHTERGTERVEALPGGLFRGEGRGRWAAARLHGDGSVSGLFENQGFVMRVKPVDQQSRGAVRSLLALYSQSRPAHHISYIPPPNLFRGRAAARRASSQQLHLNFTRNVVEEFDIAVDSHDDFDAGTDVPSDHVPRHGLKIAAMKHWAGQRWFPGCFPGDSHMQLLKLGVILDVKAWQKHGKAILEHVQDAVHQASFVYEMQMDIRLKIDTLKIYKSSHNAPEYAVGCPANFMNTKLSGLSKKYKLRFNAATHLFTGCGTDYGTVGLAYMGSLCSSKFNYGVNQIHDKKTENTFLIFAHELGHNFGGDHTFEEGQGRTGGIMDYGDGHLHGVYQFNSKYRKQEMCATLKKSVNRCKGNLCALHDPRPQPLPPLTDGCVTVGSGGVGRGHKCVFPFVYKSITYHGCTGEDHLNIWCATSVGSSGEYQDGKWGSCSWTPQCMGKDSPCVTEGTAGVGAGHNCIFPFNYAGKEFKTCTWLLHKGLWCATKVDGGGKMQQWGECERSDYCMDHWKTVGWAGIPETMVHELGNQAKNKFGDLKDAAQGHANGFYDATIGKLISAWDWFKGSVLGTIEGIKRKIGLAPSCGEIKGVAGGFQQQWAAPGRGRATGGTGGPAWWAAAAGCLGVPLAAALTVRRTGWRRHRLSEERGRPAGEGGEVPALEELRLLQ